MGEVGLEGLADGLEAGVMGEVGEVGDGVLDGAVERGGGGEVGKEADEPVGDGMWLCAGGNFEQLGDCAADEAGGKWGELFVRKGYELGDCGVGGGGLAEVEIDEGEPKIGGRPLWLQFNGAVQSR